MTATITSSPSKIILFGEHAVVYGKPAIAIPVRERTAKVKIFPKIGDMNGKILFKAPQINFEKAFDQIDDNHPFRLAVKLVTNHLKLNVYPACQIQIGSTIPLSSGMGSSAAIAVALINALFQFVGYSPNEQELAEFAYQLEIINHGTPSGIDNTVIAYNKPLFFQQNKPPQFLQPGKEYQFLIAESGIDRDTKTALKSVREKWGQDQYYHQSIFEKIGTIATKARTDFESGNLASLGKLMIENQYLLHELGVSHPKLEALVSLAMDLGASGAKLSGGGLGGIIIILTNDETDPELSYKLIEHGASDCFPVSVRRETLNE
jgi:mevalonate kinase